MTIKHLFRYPIKGLSGESLDTVELKPGYGMPFDRKFALALPGTEFDSANPKPVPKFKFVVLMKYERLASLTTRFDDQNSRFTITDQTGTTLVDTSLAEPAGIEALESFFADFMKDQIDGTPRLVQAEGHQFTDVSVHSKSMMHAVSFINLASVRALEEATGKKVDPDRFRGNILYDNDAPWSEFDLLGKTIQVGESSMEVVRRTRRCPATQVNPVTAERDLDVPALIKSNYDHMDMGIYAEIRQGGRVAVGDEIALSDS
ncbi:MAG: MOSC domain-containing protein [Burkholderiaceae bacterium]